VNQARTLHEASQLAIKGYKVIVSCPCLPQGQDLAKRLLEGVAANYLLYKDPCSCTHEPTGPGWVVRFRNQGEVFFSCFFSEQDQYFDYYFGLRSVEEIRAEILDKGIVPISIPLKWKPVSSLIRENVYVPSRYERVQANFSAL
jgi:hypothetical protein